jgi:hypothetical protein
MLSDRRGRMRLHPRHLHIGEREMHDVDGVRNLAQEAA